MQDSLAAESSERSLAVYYGQPASQNGVICAPAPAHPSADRMWRAFLTAYAALAVASAGEATATVVPLPASLELVDGSSLTLAANFSFSAAAAGAPSVTLLAALDRFRAILFRGGRGAAGGDSLPGCTVLVQSQSVELSPATDESYRLAVAATGCSIVAPTVFGAMHGMETFVQLVSHGPELLMRVPLATVEDHPRFQLRATMIDTSRHFLPVASILHHLDAMSCTKMNLLHWHIVDSQSWPYVSTAFPQLAEHGSYGPAEVYTPAAIDRVVKYASARGIMVMPVRPRAPARSPVAPRTAVRVRRLSTGSDFGTYHGRKWTPLGMSGPGSRPWNLQC